MVQSSRAFSLSLSLQQSLWNLAEHSDSFPHRAVRPYDRELPRWRAWSHVGYLEIQSPRLDGHLPRTSKTIVVQGPQSKPWKAKQIALSSTPNRGQTYLLSSNTFSEECKGLCLQLPPLCVDGKMCKTVSHQRKAWKVSQLVLFFSFFYPVLTLAMPVYKVSTYF